MSRKAVQEVFRRVFRWVFGAGSGPVQVAVQAPEPPLNTPAPCVQFRAGSAVPLEILVHLKNKQTDSTEITRK